LIQSFLTEKQKTFCDRWFKKYGLVIFPRATEKVDSSTLANCPRDTFEKAYSDARKTLIRARIFDKNAMLRFNPERKVKSH
jgi:hypothetical protein